MEYAGSLEDLKEIWMRVYTGHVLKWAVTNPAQDVEASIPSLVSNDRFVFASTPEVLSRKTIDSGSTMLGLTSTQAGYLTVTESVPAFMAAWRAFFQPNAKAAAWGGLSTSAIENLSGVTSNIQTQFGSNTSQHSAFNVRLAALEATSSGVPASAHIIVDSAVKSDSIGALFTTVVKTFAAPAEFIPKTDASEGAMYVVSNKAAGSLTVLTYDVPEGGHLWLRRTGGMWYACESGGAILPSQLIEIIDLPGGDTVEDMSPQNIVFVRRAAPNPGSVKFADGLNHPDKIYFCTNYSAESSLYCMSNDELDTFEVLPRRWAVFSFDYVNAAWIQMESGLLDVSEGGGPAGLNQSSIVLTNDYQDMSSYDWLFAEKTSTDELTFTLRLAPTSGTLVQVKNSGTAGNIIVNGNGNNIGAVGSINVVPGTFAWLLFRGSAWYLLEVVLTQQLADTLTLPVASNCEVYVGEPAQWLSADNIDFLLRDSEVTIGSITAYVTSYTGTLLKCVALTPTLFVILYIGQGVQYSEPMYIQVVIKRGTTLEFGVPITVVASQTTGLIDLIRLNDTQFVAKYDRYCRVGTVSGLTVTQGTASALTTENPTKSKMYRLADNKFINVYAISTGIKARAATVATNTITYGTVLNFTGSFTNLLGCCQMDSARILVITGYQQQQFYKIVTNTSGTSLTQGVEFEDVYDNGVNMLEADGMSVNGVTGNIAIRTYAYETDILRVVTSGATVSSVTKTALGISAGAQTWDVFWQASKAFVAGLTNEKTTFVQIDFSDNDITYIGNEVESNLTAQTGYQRTAGTSLATLPDLSFALVVAEGSGLSTISIKLMRLGAQTAGISSLYRSYMAPIRQLIPLNLDEYFDTPRHSARNISKVWSGGQVLELYTFYKDSMWYSDVVKYDPRDPRDVQFIYGTSAIMAPITYAVPNRIVAAGEHVFSYASGRTLALTKDGIALGFVEGIGFQYKPDGDPSAWLQQEPVAITNGSATYLALNEWHIYGGEPSYWAVGVSFVKAVGNTYRILPASNILGEHYLASYADSFYMRTGTTIKQRTAAQTEAGTAPTTWYTNASLLANPHQVFMFKSATDLWFASVAAGKIQLARPSALTNTLTITTDAFAVADPDRWSMRVIPITDTWMLAVYNWDHQAGIKSIKARVIELSGSTLSLGTENTITMYGLYMGGSNVASALSAVMIGDRYSIQVSVSDDGIAVNDILIQVVDKNTVRPALRMGTVGEYLGLVDQTDGTTATVKLGPLAEGFTGLAVGTEYFVSEPGGLTQVEKVRETRVGRALSPTQIRQRGPLVD